MRKVSDSMILNDMQIKMQMKLKHIITPFIDRQVREKDGKRVISYGLSSYGYDIRLGNEFKLFRYPVDTIGVVVDPKNMEPEILEDCTVGDNKPVIIPPNAFALGRSVEKFKMPRDITGICLGKSTYARCGIIVNITPLEAGWEGILTIEISNTTPLPAAVYAGEGIAQVLFFRGEPCLTSYADRGGKYQGQEGITVARM
jgi:dCTP deaminase